MQIERLASGLLHEPGVVVAKLDGRPKEAAAFITQMLGVTHLPTLLLYPEAAPGFLTYTGAQ